jgi:hypothetical protein
LYVARREYSTTIRFVEAKNLFPDVVVGSAVEGHIFQDGINDAFSVPKEVDKVRFDSSELQGFYLDLSLQISRMNMFAFMGRSTPDVIKTRALSCLDVYQYRCTGNLQGVMCLESSEHGLENRKLVLNKYDISPVAVRVEVIVLPLNKPEGTFRSNKIKISYPIYS